MAFPLDRRRQDRHLAAAAPERLSDGTLFPLSPLSDAQPYATRRIGANAMSRCLLHDCRHVPTGFGGRVAQPIPSGGRTLKASLIPWRNQMPVILWLLGVPLVVVVLLMLLNII
jgi:hypothetical protein